MDGGKIHFKNCWHLKNQGFLSYYSYNETYKLLKKISSNFLIFTSFYLRVCHFLLDIFYLRIFLVISSDFGDTIWQTNQIER